MNKKKYRFCFEKKELTNVDHSGNSNESCSHSESVINDQNNTVNIKNINFDGSKWRVLTTNGAAHTAFDEFFNSMVDDFYSLNVTQSDNVKIIKMFKDLISETKKLCDSLWQDKTKNNINRDSIPFVDTFNQCTEYITDKLINIDTIYKQKKIRNENVFYVEPIEKPIGLKWKSKLDPSTGIPDHKLTQTTFHYVSILKTLTTLFSQQNFKEMYIQYNLVDKHECLPGVYQDFCCADVHKKHKLYDDPTALKLIISNDDFETCCALKSKAGKHKVNATYFQIRNIPEHLRSKLDFVFLVALCETINLKSNGISYDNNIAPHIVEEIRILETVGILVDGVHLKGSISSFACDNLGANQVFGFTESFNCHYYCRRCEMPKSVCLSAVKEDESMLRNLSSYNECVKNAEKYDSIDDVDLKATKGIKKRCKFNELENFHITENSCFDLMHDSNEGWIAVCLKRFFERCIKDKIMDLFEIQRRVRDFPYPPSYKAYSPSLINLKKKGLNQNAVQIYCLIIHLPFIFIDDMHKVKKIWKPVETLLKCLTVLYSTKITDKDLESLTTNSEEHLKSVKDVFKINFTAKQHNLSHYPNNIKSMGPPILTWTMRSEAKHKFFTNVASKACNFKNITYTMASVHQKAMCKKADCEPKITRSKDNVLFSNSAYFEKYKSIIDESPEISNHYCHVLKFAKYDTFDYRSGTLIICHKKIYEIELVLQIEKEIFFLCCVCNAVNYDSSKNSIKIKKSVITQIFKLKDLENKKPRDKISVNNNHFIICDTLDVYECV